MNLPPKVLEEFRNLIRAEVKEALKELMVDTTALQESVKRLSSRQNLVMEALAEEIRAVAQELKQYNDERLEEMNKTIQSLTEDVTSLSVNSMAIDTLSTLLEQYDSRLKLVQKALEEAGILEEEPQGNYAVVKVLDVLAGIQEVVKDLAEKVGILADNQAAIVDQLTKGMPQAAGGMAGVSQVGAPEMPEEAEAGMGEEPEEMETPAEVEGGAELPEMPETSEEPEMPETPEMPESEAPESLEAEEEKEEEQTGAEEEATEEAKKPVKRKADLKKILSDIEKLEQALDVKEENKKTSFKDRWEVYEAIINNVVRAEK